MKTFPNLDGIWSATPTPLTTDYEVDAQSVRSMVEHHYQLGVKGLFIGGTCGEGPLLPRESIRQLTQTTCQAAKEKLLVSVQVTDNSYIRVLQNIEQAKADGADIAVVCEPWFDFPHTSDAFKEKYYFEIVERSPLPVGIYFRKIYISLAKYRQLLMHPNVCMLKDSSLNDELLDLCVSVHKERNEISILTGDEFGTIKYLQKGYTGILCGGGILTGALLNQMLDAANDNDFDKVAEIQKLCDNILYTVYGGLKFASWLSGLKYTLHLMDVFKTYTCFASYPLPDSVKQDIKTLLEEKRDLLLPYTLLQKD